MVSTTSCESTPRYSLLRYVWDKQKASILIESKVSTIAG